MATSLIDLIAVGLMCIGLFFVFTSALGVVRFPDIYTRLHAISKGTTFGFTFIIIGAAILVGDPSDIAKSLLAVAFQFLTGPVSAHMIARVGLRRGIRPVRGPQKGPKSMDDNLRIEPWIDETARKSSG